MRGEDRRARSGSPEAAGADPADAYEDLRPLLLSVTYRMVGSYAQAEDLVQEGFVRYQQALRSGTEIVSTKAFLVTVVTRLAIDHLRSSRVRRETYVGPWLPDPLVDEMAPDVVQAAELAESLSTAFLIVLGTLTPRERAVFLLHEAFGYDHATIAATLGITEVNCRQIAARARQRVAGAEPRFDASPEDRDRLAERFFAASRRGDVDALVDLLAEDAVFVGDGGAEGRGMTRAVVGREAVGRTIAAFTRGLDDRGVSLEHVHVGAQPAVLLVDRERRIFGVWSLHVADGLVREIHGMVNPHKLGHLGAVSPLVYRRTPLRPDGGERRDRGDRGDRGARQGGDDDDDHV
jgi:RNA polymerase sigma-70 factor (ECF subfamily)